jgi:hypothetical protein
MNLRPDSIDRREALRRAALLLGGAISAPTLAAMLAGCEPPTDRTGWRPRALTEEQAALVAAIAEQIIPETDTPGARTAGVHRFIDVMLAEYYAPDERAAFLAGLADVDQRARAATGKHFLRLSDAEQHDLLRALDADAYRAAPREPTVASAPKGQNADRGGTENATADQRKADPTRAQPNPGQPYFFRTMKELTLLGYYSSEIGATRELRYARVPGRFDGCVPFATVGRAWSV